MPLKLRPSFFSVLLMAWSFLAIFHAPAKPFFYLALLATETGQYLAILALLAYPLNKQIYCILAAILFMTPALRANHLERLNWVTLFLGTHGPSLKPQTVTFSKGPRENLLMDIYPQPSGAKRPCLLIIHSGGWTGGDRTEFGSFSRHFARQGYVVASIDYRLSPEHRFPAARDDVFEALHYLKENATSFGLDTGRIVLLGRSAGGQLALSAAYQPEGKGLCGVIAMYSPNDLKLAYMKPGNPLMINSRKLIGNYLGGSLDQVPAQYEAASPLFHAGAQSPPTLLIHGGRDEYVSPIHSRRLAEKLSAAGRPFEYLELPWATHGADFFLNGPSGQLITRSVEKFLQKITGGPSS